MDEFKDQVANHYGLGGLRSRIETALAGRETDAPLSERDVSGAAEFHIGGRAASEYLIAQLKLGATSGTRVLDLGSGLGGTARLIATLTGASVEGVDLTPEFVDVATWLSEITGCSESTAFRVGSIVDPLPWSHEFDAATMVHVGMNIEDKPTMAASISAALRPGGTFAVYDIMAGTNAEPLDVPVPWAVNAATSHVSPAEDYVAALETAGFAIDSIEDRSEWAVTALTAPPANDPPAVNLGLVMGPDTPIKVANMRANLVTGRIAPTVIVAHKK